jgi:hypothetical protein
MIALAKSGYSATPLPTKLGMKPGQAVAFVGLPEKLVWLREAEAFATVGEAHEWAAFDPPKGRRFDLIHAFSLSAAEIEAGLLRLRSALRQSGMLWVSWPKKASGIGTDATEDVIRRLALRIGLVDVKVCAVDPIWSGLKLVIPLDRRVPEQSKG